VLVREVCRALVPALGEPDGVLVDATCGLAGHLIALVEAGRPARAFAFDRDPDARALARQRLDEAGAHAVTLVDAPFSSMAERLRDAGVARGSAGCRRCSSIAARAASRGAWMRRSTCAWIPRMATAPRRSSRRSTPAR
jgi:precorrin-6B methylase 2